MGSASSLRGDVALRTADLAKIYPPSLRALEGIDFALPAGEIHGLLGANGAGKSSLIKVLSGVERPTSGTIWVRGAGTVSFRTPLDAHAAGIGVVHQELPLLPNLTAAENVALGLQPGGLMSRRDRRGCRADYDRIAADFPGAPPADALLANVGLQAWQLTAIIRAHRTGAQVLILDEPTSSLNPDERTVLHENLRKVARKGTAVLYVSHFLDDVLEVCDAVTVLRDGRVELSRATAGLTEHDLLRAMIGEQAGPPAAPAARQTPTEAEEGLSGTKIQVAGVGPLEFRVPLGGRVGLYGLEGSGCTEVLQAAFGLRPSTGALTWRGHAIAGDPRTRIDSGMAFISGDRPRTLIGTWSVAMNCSIIDLGSRCRVAGLSRERERRKAQRSIARFAIKGEPGQPLRTLSGGNQQKVALGRWLDRSGICLLADDPTRGVDVRGRAAIHRSLIDFCAAGNALLVRSTDPEELVELCDRVLVMVNGRISRELTGASLTAGEIEASTRTKVRSAAIPDA